MAKAVRPKQGCMRSAIGALVFFIVLVLSIAVALNLKNTMDLQHILEESIKSQLISISIAARSRIDVDKFSSYNSMEDVEADRAAYNKTLTGLRLMVDELDVKYIYALKEIDGKYYFVFDTDLENPEVFIEYELSPIHEQAFAGKNAAGIMSVTDEYGTFNSGAVPIFKEGRVVGIICTDLEDVYVRESIRTARVNMILLIVALLLAMGFMLFTVIRLLRRITQMQNKLQHMAHHDTVTGLPNRQYLLEYLDGLTRTQSGKPFALLFIDLDNFKTVNDNAGHDAGDELLRHIAAYLGTSDTGHTKAFRPAAGKLNIAARIGGDEFIQVIEGISTPQQAAEVAQKLLDGFTSSHIDRYVEKYKVGLSIGIALYPYHTDDYHVLISYADLAMYHAKRAGKNQHRVYVDEMSQSADVEE